MHRRRFFEGTAAALMATLGSRAASAQTPEVSRGSAFDPWFEVNREHLAHNVTEVSRLAGGRPILAVIKNNGYGHGVVPIAQALSAAPQVRGLAVVKLSEALAIREAGVTTPLLLMGTFDEANLAEMHARDIMPMVYTPIGPALERIAARSGKPVRLHVCVDTGLGREGVPHREAPALIRDLAGRPGLSIEGVMTTFTEDEAFDQEQLRRFESLVAGLTASGVKVGLRHAASSYTLFQHGNAFLDMVRPGMALFGVYPEPQFRGLNRMTLRPAGALRARVAYVKKLAKGESAGYNRAFVAAEDTWVATLPVGHVDGWPRVAAKGARVRIGSELYPVIASVSASHTIVNIGREPKVAIGEVVTMWDWQDGSRPEDIAIACGASVYDLLMHLGGHLPRR